MEDHSHQTEEQNRFGSGIPDADLIRDSAESIRGSIIETPLRPVPEYDIQTGARIYLKLENRQHTGSFKARGALNKVLRLAADKPGTHIVTASTGNHALGVARALQITGMSGTIYLPENASTSKIKALKAYHAELKFYGKDPLATELFAKHHADDEGLEYISPYNDADVIAGQGTIGVELTEQLEDIAAVYVTIGGGGLASGIALWFTEHSPETEIIGCLPERSPEMKLSVDAGHVIHLEHPLETLSDGSAGGCEDDAVTFSICRKLIRKYILIDEDAIAAAIRDVYHITGERIEGSAGVAVAAMLQDAGRFAGRNVVVIVCGGNIDDGKFEKIVQS